jgi:beta-aspartyl-peptidase (threonine type)
VTLTKQSPAIAIHGGAGNLARYSGTGRIEEAHIFLDGLIDDLHQNLIDGATSIEVTTDAVVALENAGFFHAGKGSVLNDRGYVELDASIMDGTTLNAGAVALIRNTRNPIRLAAHVLFYRHEIFIAGEPADDISKQIGLEQVPLEYFVRCDQVGGKIIAEDTLESHGTVGAVARDQSGHFSSATSTGGTLKKAAGRIGDTPLIGAGTYAKDRVGAVSSTGYGEYFIREVAAYQVIARMEFLGEAVGAAAGYVLHQIAGLNGSGGFVALGSRGEVSMPFNTTGMYRAAIDAWGKKTVGVL